MGTGDGVWWCMVAALCGGAWWCMVVRGGGGSGGVWWREGGWARARACACARACDGGRARTHCMGGSQVNVAFDIFFLMCILMFTSMGLITIGRDRGDGRGGGRDGGGGDHDDGARGGGVHGATSRPSSRRLPRQQQSLLQAAERSPVPAFGIRQAVVLAGTWQGMPDRPQAAALA